MDYDFLIMSAPDDSSMKRCIKDLNTYNVKHIIRSCEKTYDESLLEAAGIKVTELIYDDGKLPNQEIIDKLSEIVDNFFKKDDAKSSQTE